MYHWIDHDRLRGHWRRFCRTHGWLLSPTCRQSIVVLEARDRIGGRTTTVNLAEGGTIDLGGQWIGPGQERVYRLAQELQVPIFPTYDQGKHMFEDGGEIKEFAGAVPALDAESMLDLSRAMSELDALAKKLDIIRPWSSPDAPELDSQTLLLAIEPDRISLLHVLFYIASGKGLDGLIAVTGGAQQDRFVEGTGALAFKLLQTFQNSIRFNTPVLAIEQDAEGVTVITESGTVRAKRAIVALPPTLAARIQYRPVLSADRDQLTQSVPTGSVIKCMAVYSEPFWRSAGYSGQSFSTSGAVISTCDNTPQSGVPGILVGFVVGSHAESLRRCSDGERRKIVLEEFKKWCGPEALLPLRYVDLSWADEAWSRGGFFGNFAPGVLSSFGEALRNPQGLIHWAGAETAREWIGFIEGAIESGERAATEVISACEPSIRDEKQ